MLYRHKFDAACVSISLSDIVTEQRSSPILGYGLANGGIGVVELMRNRSQTIWQLDPIQMQGGECAPVSLVKMCRLDKKAAVM